MAPFDCKVSFKKTKQNKNILSCNYRVFLYHVWNCFFDLSMSVEIFITSFKSVCGRMSVDNKCELILDEKFFKPPGAIA